MKELKCCCIHSLRALTCLHRTMLCAVGWEFTEKSVMQPLLAGFLL
jgi:hypothetical protein